MNKYIEITKGFAISNDKKQNGVDYFAYSVGLNGKYYVSSNVVVTHPGLVSKENILVEMSIGEFKKPEEDQI